MVSGRKGKNEEGGPSMRKPPSGIIKASGSGRDGMKGAESDDPRKEIRACSLLVSAFYCGD